MYKDYKIVVCTPSGRRRYLELLVPQVLAYGSVVDEYRLWVNTSDAKDIAWMKEQAEANPKIFLERHTNSIDTFSNCTIHHFFKNTVDEKTIYIRFDDDVILLDTLPNFLKFLDYRIDNPDNYLVFANILNNAIVSHIQQRAGNIPLNNGIAGYKCTDPVGWGDPMFAKHIHDTIIANNFDLDTFKMNDWICYSYERVSINAMAWFGKDFAQFDGQVDRDEEVWLTTIKPKQLQRMNVIYGGYNVVHFAFHPQREVLETHGILAKYGVHVKELLEKTVVVKEHLATVADIVKSLEKLQALKTPQETAVPPPTIMVSPNDIIVPPPTIMVSPDPVESPPDIPPPPVEEVVETLVANVVENVIGAK